jgi:hypothetical protein
MATTADDETAGRREYDPNAEHAFPDARLNEVLNEIRDDPEITTYLEAQNVNAVTRKGYNDHGTKHVGIVRDRALRLYDLLKTGGVRFNGASQQGLEEADEPVIVALAATLHDVGHVVHRDQHSYYSIPLAADILDRLLPSFYDVEAQVRVKAEVLHAILCHHTEEEPLTREAGVIRIADGLDMEQGRSRVPYEKGLLTGDRVGQSPPGRRRPRRSRDPDEQRRGRLPGGLPAEGQSRRLAARRRRSYRRRQHPR